MLLFFYCLFVCKSSRILNTCTWFCTCLARSGLLPKDLFFSNQAFAPACVSNQAVGRQVHPAKACCEILWLSWSPTHCCELQNGGFCQSFTFLLRRHCIKFSETFWFLIQTFVGATYGKKQRKNCKCGHHHSLFKGHDVIVHIKSSSKIVIKNCLQDCSLYVKSKS